ncbi:hypothetical protein K4F52_005772 [Lecanicillium sp. MT-2017a]|nr:hypothetical protein K4F52_005772 [Lecanicillium sp. MT-2017a]
MAIQRSLVAVATALSLGSFTQATNYEFPPCVDKYTPFTSQGCFTNADNALIMRSKASNKDMTVEKCTAICKGNAFRYAGLTYYGVCYCGNVVDGEKTDDSKCNLPCNGDKSETCGGNGFLTVLEDPTFTKTPDQVAVGDYNAAGCYVDNYKDFGRAIPYPMQLDHATFTPEACIGACKAAGFPIAGTEYGHECYCGNLLTNTIKADAAECKSPCNGDASKTCGGGNRLNVYVAKDLESTEPCPGNGNPPDTTTTKSPATTTKPGQDTTTKPGQDTTTKPTTKPGQDTTTKPGQDTTTKPGQDTTTKPKPTTKPGQDTTTKPGQDTTTMPGWTTTTKPQPTTTNGEICTTTTTIPPKCEHQIGNWCLPPTPEWNCKADCIKAWKQCELNVCSCFSEAGWPASLNCYAYAAWCKSLSKYCWACDSSKHCNKLDCWKQHEPGHAGTTITKTITTPCPTTTKEPATTTPGNTDCPPQPTNVCKQPSSKDCDYGPGNPVGGVPLPIVTCNDVKSDWPANPWKLYNHHQTHNCPSFPGWQVPKVCQQACKIQYNNCIAVYANSCYNLQSQPNFHPPRGVEKRGSWSSSSSSSSSSGAWAGAGSGAWAGTGGTGACAIAGAGGVWAGAGGANCGTWGGNPNPGVCKGPGSYGGGAYASAGASAGSGAWASADAWSGWGHGNNSYNNAVYRCKVQYEDCLHENNGINPGKMCEHWGCD